ncbi:neopullulanase [Tetragenococcus muriaticus PMC-11-5]|nr:neopullulanase [Tetragenococcus muriaticus PMC-11-5]
MNYAYTDAIMGYFVKNQLSLQTMVATINQQLMLYRDQTNQMQFNVLDSHDTPRLLTETKEDKNLMKQVLAFTYLQPGVPCLYYGDEIGMTGGMDPECRKCMIWEEKEQDQDLLQFVKKLIALRKSWQKVLSQGSMEWTVVNEQNGQLILERRLADHKLQAVFNAGKAEIILDKNGEVLLANRGKVNETNLYIQEKGFMVLKV